MRGLKQNRYRTEPPFPNDIWNILHGTTNDQPRANNSIEALHKALHSATNTYPTVLTLFECLRRVGTLAPQRLIDLRLGGDDSKKKYRSVSEKLGNIIRLKSYRDERFPRKHYSMSPHILVRRIESFLSYSLELNQYFKKMLVRFIGRLELSAACPHVGKLFVGVKTQTFVYSLVVCSVL